MCGEVGNMGIDRKLLINSCGKGNLGWKGEPQRNWRWGGKETPHNYTHTNRGWEIHLTFLSITISQQLHGTPNNIREERKSLPTRIYSTQLTQARPSWENLF